MNSFNRREFCTLTGLSAASLLRPETAGSDESKTIRPNVVFILADDLGWAELGCYGNMFNETPNLDALARKGVRFTDAYAAAPVCSPFRASLMSGQYPARVGITDYLRPNDPKHLSEDYVTLAEAFKQAGYATGMIGKWHLTGYANHGAKEVPPSRHGFDETIVSENRGIGGGSYFHPYHFNREIEKRLPGREFLVDRCNLEATEFIERHKDEPFFLYVSHYAVHTRLDGRPDRIEKYSKKSGAGKDRKAKKNNPHLAAQLESIDEGVGQIVRKLEVLNLSDRTIVVFMSDNGGEDRVTSNAPLRAGKSTLYEGGIRVPLIVHWPGETKPNQTCHTPLSSIDLYPTLCQMVSLEPGSSRQPLDGKSIIPSLINPESVFDRKALYWHYPLEKPHFLGGRSSGAIRAGDWKLIEFYENGQCELYNLADDIGEKHNLARQHPDRVNQLKRQLTDWREKTGATIPAGQHVQN